jgi:hypothetical protein
LKIHQAGCVQLAHALDVPLTHHAAAEESK